MNTEPRDGDSYRSEGARLLAAGTRIAHFRIIEALASGGMGEVYLAEDTDLKRQVALKLLPPELSADPRHREQLKGEAQAAAGFSHPHVVTVYEVGEHDNRAFIAMEYVPGESLRSVVSKGHLPSAQIIRLFTQLCQALGAAHRAGIVHRDIKPRNILIDGNGDAKLLDFGLAVSAPAAIRDSGNMVAGTVAYMSPEQARGESVDSRSDIFSLGVLLYELVSGLLPFRGDYEAAVQYSLLNRDPEPIRDWPNDLPRAIERVILKALAKQPNDRYQTTTDMLDDFLAILPGDSDSLSKSARTTPDGPSIAVLPFADMSPHHDQDYFCDGMADELITVLNHLGGIRVASRTSAFQFKGRNIDVREVGRTLSVTYALEGSVRKAEMRLRISAKLINVADGYTIWSESYDRDLQDVFAIQEEISRAIAENLKVRLIGSPERPFIPHRTDNIEAYNLYLKGRYFWNKRYEGGLQKGIEYFSQAIELDPAYAPAYAGLADSYNIIGFYNFQPPVQVCPQAKALARKALAFDSHLVEAQTALGWSLTFYDWDFVAAERQLKRALELNPNYATACHYYALLLVALGRFDEGIALIRRALEIDPLTLIFNATFGGLLYFARRPDESLEQHRKTLDMDPGFPLTHAYMAGPLIQRGQADQAVLACRKAHELSGESTYAASMLAFSQAAVGDLSEAKRILNKLVELSRTRYVSAYHIALPYGGLGDADNAILWLEKAFEERDNWMVWLAVHPAFDPVRSDPRFADLVRRVGLPT